MAAAARTSTTVGLLVRAGFSDLTRSASLLDDPALEPLGDGLPDVIGALGDTPDPDLALLGLVRVLGSLADDRASEGATLADLVSELTTNGPGRRRLVAILGMSTALIDHLVRHPDQWLDAARAQRHTPEELRAEILAAVTTGRGDRPPLEALRIAYRRALLRIVAIDLTEPDPLAEMPAVGRALAALAEAALEGALAIAREEYGPGHEQCRLAVIGMGKTGGGELNYVSDVDVIFVGEPADGANEQNALAVGTVLAAGVMRACSAPTPEGTLWPVDAALRPEGRQGPLVRTIESHRLYYERWAKTWEFQALLKARISAGDREIGERYLTEISPLVWTAADRENFVEDVQAMRRRVEQNVPSNEAARQLKLGPGGLRDVEFSVQLLQLVHGRADTSLRSATTLDALPALSKGGYVAREDAATLDEAYRRLRCLEHRIQLYRLRRTHLMPSAPDDLRRLGRAMGHRLDPVAAVVADREATAREVRRIYERLFYRPLLAAAARLGPEARRLTPEAASERLAALGFRDPSAAMRHIEALTAGLSRRAAIQRTLLPVMLGWFADEADPDAGLLSFRRVSDALGTTHWYLKMLRDEGRSAELLAHVLACSRFAADLLITSPESVAIFGEPAGLVPRTREALTATMRSAAGRRDDADEAITSVRTIRRHELLRIVIADLIGALDVREVGTALTDLTAATLQAAVDVAVSAVTGREGRGPGGDLLVIAMGSFGGGEMGYTSDADVMFVHRAHPGMTVDSSESSNADSKADSNAATTEEQAQQWATLVVQEVLRLLAGPGPDPQLMIDADLRPEGKSGPLVRSLDAYRVYYERWALTWESQALLRAVPIVGPDDLADEFQAMIDPLRWPEGGLSAPQVRDIRTLKARMEAERLPRGADRRTHIKLGLGGQSDVEWTVQLAQLQHAHEHESLRVPGTVEALDAVIDVGIINGTDGRDLRAAWLLGARLRNAGMLWRGRPIDSTPSDVRDADAVGRIIGRPIGEGPGLADFWKRHARRARHAMSLTFYDRTNRGNVLTR